MYMFYDISNACNSDKSSVHYRALYGYKYIDFLTEKCTLQDVGEPSVWNT